MKIAVVGCTHGHIEDIYDEIQRQELEKDCKVDLLLCCGDFQALRNTNDFAAFACPKKYHHLGSFHKYYNGEKKAPVLTLVIGGNHEASNYLQELPYGGWLAPNIYYMGYAGVVNFGGLRIAGISGIFNSSSYEKGHHEYEPYNRSTLRSVYYYRSLEIFRLKLLKGPISIMMSHDWPHGIEHYGNLANLLRQKKYAADQIRAGDFGAPPLKEVLHILRPTHWFAGHYHVKFPATVTHDNQNKVNTTTQFLALDKCGEPGRPYLEIVDIRELDVGNTDPAYPDTLDGAEAFADPAGAHHSPKRRLEYDLEWLAILQKTNSLNKLTSEPTLLPNAKRRIKFVADEDDMDSIRTVYGDDLIIHPISEQYSPSDVQEKAEFKLPINNQTSSICEKLHIIHPNLYFTKLSEDQVEDSSSIRFDDRDDEFEISFE